MRYGIYPDLVGGLGFRIYSDSVWRSRCRPSDYWEECLLFRIHHQNVAKEEISKFRDAQFEKYLRLLPLGSGGMEEVVFAEGVNADRIKVSPTSSTVSAYMTPNCI